MDHTIVLQLLCSSFDLNAVNCTALSWFCTYVSGCWQNICCHDER